MKHLLPRLFLLLATCAVTLLGSGCATVATTEQGAIGLERKQYFADGARETMVASAAGTYDKILNGALRAEALNTDAAQVARIVGIANRLIPHVAIFRPEALTWDWEVNLLDSDMVNATCMAGGKIFVFTGLLDTWQPTDDELAAVIGHEIGHALRDHTAEKYSTRTRNNSVMSGLSAIVSIGLAASTGINLSNTIDQAGKVGIDAFANLPNSRELETESDRIGLELMARAGYDPTAATSLWRKVAQQAREKGQDTKGAFWSTHPSDDRRVEDLQTTEPSVRPLYLAARQQLDRNTAPAADAGGQRAAPTPSRAASNTQAGKADKAARPSAQTPRPTGTKRKTQ